MSDTALYSMAYRNMDLIDKNNNDDERYRYYHCYEKWPNTLQCTRINNPSDNLLSPHKYTKLLFVEKSIPQIFDKAILKYRWSPKRIIIENNQPKTK